METDKAIEDKTAPPKAADRERDIQTPRDNVTRHHEPKLRQWPHGSRALNLHRCTPPNVFARDHDRWQVSWLAGPCLTPSSRFPSDMLASRSPLTVAGTAAVFHRVPYYSSKEEPSTGRVSGVTALRNIQDGTMRDHVAPGYRTVLSGLLSRFVTLAFRRSRADACSMHLFSWTRMHVLVDC